jgi:hypothetical protein
MEYFFISKIGDEVVGYVRAVADGPGTLRITMSRLAVQWHHTSIPVSLLNNVHDFCCHSGFSTVVLDPAAIPRVSLRVLQRCGFQPRSAQGRLGRSMLEYEVSMKAEPVLGELVGSDRATEPVPSSPDARVAVPKSQRSRARADRSGDRNPR